MALRGYISWLENEHKKDAKLDLEDLEILSLFAWKKYRSSYQIYSYKKSKPLSKLAYKNVNKRVHKLLESHLIEKVGIKPENKRHTNYYNLSEYGIYQLFLNKLDYIRMKQETIERGPSNITDNTKQFFNNYSDSKIFECFLFPYFEKNTLMDIGNYLLIDLFEYIADWCRRIETALQSITFRYSIPMFETMFLWNKISGEDKSRLANFLKHEYDLEDNIVNQIKIEKDGSGNSIKIRTLVGTVYMNLIEDKRIEVKATINGPFQFREYPLQRMGKDLLVVKLTTHEDRFTNMINSSKREMEQLIYRLICKLGSTTDNETNHFSKVLSEDVRFMNAVDNFYRNDHRFFDSGCAKLNYNVKSR